MIDFPNEQIAIEKDGKCYMCTLRVTPVKGGYHVLYVADDGSIIKKEPLHRYKERINRRNESYKKQESEAFTQKVNERILQYKKSIHLYHGNPDHDFIPVYGQGREYHDYGNAFYCTEDFDSAAEWACLRKTINMSFVYEYELQIPDNITPQAKILDFDKLDPIYWLSALLQHRVNNDEGYLDELRERSIALTEIYPTNCDNYDIIFGWRADDRHFAIIRDFLSTLISLETAKKAITLGNLGKQVVIKSERAYVWLRYPDSPLNKTHLSGNEYNLWHNSFIEKDTQGRLDYDVLANEARKTAREQKKRGTTILDLLGW